MYCRHGSEKRYSTTFLIYLYQNEVCDGTETYTQLNLLQNGQRMSLGMSNKFILTNSRGCHCLYQLSESLCTLSFSHFMFMVVGVSRFTVCSAAIAAIQTTQLDPAEAIRND